MRGLTFRFTSVSLILVASVLAWSTGATGKPPAPPPPAAPGTIYFNYANDVWQMNGSGGGKQATGLAPAAGDPVRPSAGLYGGRRWWLVNPAAQSDVWATNGVRTIRITQSYDINDGVTRRIFSVKLRGQLMWSNDGQDSFLSFPAVVAELDGVTNAILWAEHRLYRVPISAQDLQDIYQAGDPDPAPLDDSSPLLEVCLASEMLYEDQFDQHAWSPDGTQVAYNFLDQSVSTGRADLYVADLTNGPVIGEDGSLVFDIPDNSFADLGSIRWSPQAVDPGGARIAFHWNGNIRSIRPDGTGGLILAAGDSPQWSPDAAYVAYTKRTLKGQTWQYQIVRITASGGSALTLTSDLPAASPKGPFAWVP